MGYINNVLCRKRVYEAKCNNVCNVIRYLWRQSPIANGSVSMDACPSQPENARKQVAGRQTPWERSHYLPQCVFSDLHPCLSHTDNRSLLLSSFFFFLIHLLSVMKLQCSVTSCCLLLEFAMSHLSSMPK